MQRAVYSFFLLFTISILIDVGAMAQPACTSLGQTPSSAFPVCGTSTFQQGSVPICGNTTIPVPCQTPSGSSPFTNKNPYWYRFTCYTSGTLGFLITPNTISDDYDWQLFDITNKNPNAVFSDNSCFVACNWSGDGGLTGSSSAGNSLVRCEGPGVPLFSSMPNIIAGHTYLLLVSHFTDTQDGYSLSFGGGTAVITDTITPHLKTVRASCDATTLTIKLNKKMKCSSLASNGSDFMIVGGPGIVSASGIGCSGGFDLDSITITLAAPLAPGNYFVKSKLGTDGNTLLDNCDNPLAVGDSLALEIFALAPTPMDSLTKPGCSPQQLELVFQRDIRCNSIAADGSDFIVNGSYPVTVVAASGNCNNGLTDRITVQLSAPLYTNGNFQIVLRQGSDGNTLVDNCAQETPAGSFIPFSIKDTVNASFQYSIDYNCSQNMVHYTHNGAHGVNQYQWIFSNGSSTIQNPNQPYTDFSPQQTTLIVSNGFCADTASATIEFNNYMKADFEVTSLVCPDDPAVFQNHSTGQIVGWIWEFGNGDGSTLETPLPYTFPIYTNSYESLITLIAINNYGCRDTAKQVVKVVNNCRIEVPSAFTPNSDGLNDFLYPLNAYKSRDLSFAVYNRFGQQVFFTRNWQMKWDGNFKGQQADPGTYVWYLQYIDTDTGRQVRRKGTTLLIR